MPLTSSCCNCHEQINHADLYQCSVCKDIFCSDCIEDHLEFFDDLTAKKIKLGDS